MNKMSLSIIRLVDRKPTFFLLLLKMSLKIFKEKNVIKNSRRNDESSKKLKGKAPFKSLWKMSKL